MCIRDRVFHLSFIMPKEESVTMVKAVVGANWGDEGKGIIKDRCKTCLFYFPFYFIDVYKRQVEIKTGSSDPG